MSPSSIKDRNSAIDVSLSSCVQIPRFMYQYSVN